MNVTIFHKWIDILIRNSASLFCKVISNSVENVALASSFTYSV